MSILYLLIPLSLILLGLAVWAFFWAVKHDQFDDLEGPAYRILFDEDENDLPPEARQRRQQPDSDDAEDTQDTSRASTDTASLGKDRPKPDRDT
ncbi:cbb3-type cytochrome oxidase assembly protein CcoS [Halomonas jincaotanensis]|uniref:cbb3-type cytochrome oxidase assembly protein CcoS n=1 Tax=Halomonas jincaotanensis TaxID=2810616 RepID=UPI002022D27B|nr:cbb3-type cytochrome oxidase assembly protein CcoS [Halomonas jincaotanensis]